MPASSLTFLSLFILFVLPNNQIRFGRMFLRLLTENEFKSRSNFTVINFNSANVGESPIFQKKGNFIAHKLREPFCNDAVGNGIAQQRAAATDIIILFCIRLRHPFIVIQTMRIFDPSWDRQLNAKLKDRAYCGPVGCVFKIAFVIDLANTERK